jgi:hypothetical protein
LSCDVEMLIRLPTNSVCILSIVRLYSLPILPRNGQHAMFYGASLGYWAAIEMDLAIVCACIPALKPLVAHIISVYTQSLILGV